MTDDEKLRNENIMLKASLDGMSSLLLDVQKDCIENKNRLNDLLAELQEICEENGCPPGINRLAFIRVKLKERRDKP